MNEKQSKQTVVEAQPSVQNKPVQYVLNINLDNTDDGPKGEWCSFLFDFTTGKMYCYKPPLPKTYFPHSAMCELVKDLHNRGLMHPEWVQNIPNSMNPKIMGTLFNSK